MKLIFKQMVNPCGRCMFGYPNLTKSLIKQLYPSRSDLPFYPDATECQNGDNYQDPIKHYSDTCESFMLNNITADEIIKL